MGFEADLQSSCFDLISTPFRRRDGRVVPTTESVGPHDYVYLDQAAYLYTDMADSSALPEKFSNEAAARILRVFLSAVCKVIRDRGGEIRSFDGDRVMAVFLGDSAADDAVDTALRITWAVSQVAHDCLLTLPSYLEAYLNDDWRLRHRTGVDLGCAWMVRGGVRSDHDLVSIGYAPNTAAKLSDFKRGGSTIISHDVYEELSANNRISVSESMWKRHGYQVHGGRYIDTYSSSWRRSYR